MPVRFENYSHSFESNAKPIFVPSELGRRIGEDIMRIPTYPPTRTDNIRPGIPTYPPTPEVLP